MFDLFGSELPLAARFFIAFLVVLALIGVTAWVVRRFGANRLGGGSARGRQPRLAVIDATTVDGRRRLVLIRRDNIEHLLMIGGPTDVVVEQNIVRAAGAREPMRAEPAAPATRAAAPAAETAWPLQPTNEPVAPVAPVTPPPRAYRAPATEEPWLPPEPGARPRPAESLTGLAAELSTKLSAPEAAPPPRREPAPMPPPPPMRAEARAEPPAPAQSDRNLADMAQQLEAALRRAPAPAPEAHPPVTDALAMPPPKAPEPPRPLRDLKPRSEPKFEPPKAEPKAELKPEAKPEPKFEPKLDIKPEPPAPPKFEAKLDLKPEPPAPPKFEPKLEPKLEPKPEPKVEAKAETKPESEKSPFDSLEEEMASLLGRQPGKS